MSDVNKEAPTTSRHTATIPLQQSQPHPPSVMHQPQPPMSQSSQPMRSVATEAAKGIQHSVDEGVTQAKRYANVAYHEACHITAHWRHYPKVFTTCLLLSAFIIGVIMSGVTMKMIGGRHYVASHWDRETADAHHALDVLLDHMKHPHLYEHAKGQSLIGRARSGLMHVFETILPTKLTSRGGARDMYEDVREKGRQVYDKMGRPIGRGNIIDKASEVASDLKYGARRTIEGAKDKFGDMTESMFGGDRDEYPGERYIREKVGKTRGGGGGLGSWLGLGKKDREYDHEPSRGNWFGSEPNHEEYEGEGDEVGMAKKKIRHVVREAERNE